MKRSTGSVVLGLLATLALAAPAHASYVGVAEDPAGDAPSGAQDLLAVGLGYDAVSGTLFGAVKTREAAEIPATVVFAAASGLTTGCGIAPAIGFASQLNQRDGAWMRFSGPETVAASGTAEKRGYGTTEQTLQVTDRQLAGLRPDCVAVSVVDPVTTAVYDTVGPIALVPQPALSLRLSGVPERVRSGRRYRLKVKVSNPGAAATGRLRVRLASARGLSAGRRALTVASVAPGKARTVTLPLRLSASARPLTDLKVSAVAGKLKVEAERRVFVRTPARTKKPSGGGGRPRPSMTCTRWIPDISGSSGGYLGLVPC
jgi:hypothetical protein